ncbi:hypothetical protein [Amycolatopsis sp. NPDC051716]|uniref:hypothetical protein n=1 Tax=Amycolatopsis sp. NPDC051716 TaxID=3155804 RepID=UPI00344A3301
MTIMIAATTPQATMIPVLIPVIDFAVVQVARKVGDNRWWRSPNVVEQLWACAAFFACRMSPTTTPTIDATRTAGSHFGYTLSTATLPFRKSVRVALGGLPNHTTPSRTALAMCYE